MRTLYFAALFYAGAFSAAYADSTVMGPVSPIPLGQAPANPTNGDALIIRESSGGNVRAPRAKLDIKSAQHALVENGYRIKEDGRAGPETTSALLQFQRENSLPPSGTFDSATLNALGVAAPENGAKAADEPNNL